MNLDLIYQIYIFSLAVVCFICEASGYKQNHRQISIFYILFSAPLVMFALLRPIGVGLDDKLGYAGQTFNTVCPTLTCGQIIQGSRDQAWYSIIGVLKSFSISPRIQLLLSSTALAIKLVIIFRLTHNKLSALLLYSSMYYLIHDITALRISVAESVYLLGIFLLSNNTEKQGACVLLVAGLFHKQAYLSPLVYISRWMRWNRLSLLSAFIPLALVIVGAYPGDKLFGHIIRDSAGERFLALMFGWEYLGGRVGGVFSESKTWSITSVFVVGFFYVMANRSINKDKLFNLSATSIVLGYALFWVYAWIPDVQNRVWDFFMLPLVFLAGNSRGDTLDCMLTITAALYFCVRYTVIHHYLILLPDF